MLISKSIPPKLKRRNGQMGGQMDRPSHKDSGTHLKRREHSSHQAHNMVFKTSLFKCAELKPKWSFGSSLRSQQDERLNRVSGKSCGWTVISENALEN